MNESKASPTGVRVAVRRPLFDLVLVIVVFFGLCGAFISNVLDMPKVHYYPLAVATVVAALRVSLHRGFLWPIFASVVLAAMSPLVASDQTGFLSYFTVMVLPFIWFCIGKYINPRTLARLFMLLTGILALGLVIELSGMVPDLFPTIGVRVGDEAFQRYGSFAINPLGLGYFAAISGLLSLIVQNRVSSLVLLCISLMLLYFADSRGGLMTFVVFVALFLWIAGRRDIHTSFTLARGLRVSLLLLAILVTLLASERGRSVFDWTTDEGNLGRLNQWAFCLSVASENPMGIGAGAMSPIGLGDDPYIEEGVVKSCDSTPLKLSVEYGFLIAFAYLLVVTGILALVTHRAYRILSKGIRSPNYRSLAVSVAMCWGIWLQQLLNQSIESIWISALFFSFMGYLFWHSRPQDLKSSYLMVRIRQHDIHSDLIPSQS